MKRKKENGLFVRTTRRKTIPTRYIFWHVLVLDNIAESKATSAAQSDETFPRGGDHTREQWNPRDRYYSLTTTMTS